ncbi:hypothetical protein AMTR_s00221p00011100 [Amborella trichopoda]|uniref:Uncharacterized protein n=1 Tax=Amborella trichopoda TaxID=13333 RepID=W1NTA1_AMBTC|nr:hypothetical protein AMTR_s00221p00011100 [Amborella trichopoda]
MVWSRAQAAKKLLMVSIVSGVRVLAENVNGERVMCCTSIEWVKDQLMLHLQAKRTVEIQALM